MDILQDREALLNLPSRADGMIDLSELGRLQLEMMVN